MRYIKLALSEFFIEHKNNLLLSLTIYLTVIICFFSIFTSMRVLQKNAVIYSNDQKAKSTFNEIQLELQEYSSCEDIIHSLDLLKNNYGAKINNVYCDLNSKELSLFIDGIGEISETILLVDNDDYKYSDNEIICSDNVYYNNKKLNKGDEIILFGEKFTVAELGSQTSISYSDFAKFNNTSLDNTSIMIDNISFPQPLSQKDYTDVSKILKPVETLVSEAEIADKNNSEVLVDQILICILISVLSVLIVITLFKQVMRNLISKIAAFKLYGCNAGFVIGFFIFSLCMFIFISFAAAVVIFNLCDNIFVDFNIKNPISFSLELMSLVIICFLSAVFTLPGSVKLARLMPAQLEIRR